MLSQYGAQRFRITRIGDRQVAVGTIALGTIVPVLERDGSARRHGAVQVVGWLPREIAGAVRYVTPSGEIRHDSRFVARGSHLALVRDLHSGRTRLISDAHLRSAVDRDLERVVRQGTGSFAALADRERRLGA